MNAATHKTGAGLIARFIATHCSPRAFVVTGGACAFIVDALAQDPESGYVCFQHEQAAAMAADAVWRTTGKVGVTVATSGPGATNLITGIACSWFDSIPSLHITGQVNQAESSEAIGAEVRQAGFQETNIVKMVSPITKLALKVHSPSELAAALPAALNSAISGRMGPVLLDVPMDVQKALIEDEDWYAALRSIPNRNSSNTSADLGLFLEGGRRPLVLIGAGSALSGSALQVQDWCEESGIPYVCSWGALSYIDRSLDGFQGAIGVYGSRHANWAVQATDRLLVLGSRLDNRQRTGNPAAFAPFASVIVVDIDPEELKKFRGLPLYETIEADLGPVSELLGNSPNSANFDTWRHSLREHKVSTADGMEISVRPGELNPYESVLHMQHHIPEDAIVVSDCGANLCWVYQSFGPHGSFLFTAGGNSPMGYSLPAAIGAQIVNPKKPVWCFIGDGGLQMNIQELQTIVHYKLPIRIVILNNHGYGIIKQFQDAYFDGRHEASGTGYSLPDFGVIASAYGIPCLDLHSTKEIDRLSLPSGPVVLNVHLPQHALITPKVEMDRFIHDQFPYDIKNVGANLPYDYPDRPSQLGGLPAPTV